MNEPFTAFEPQRCPPLSPQYKMFIVLLMFLAMVVGFLLAERVVRNRIEVTEKVIRQVTPRGDLAADEKATIELFQQSSQSVVHITTSAVGRRMFSSDVMEVRRGTGSGFVWDLLGHIVTNFHVVEGSNEFRVTFANQVTVSAILVGIAPHKDLAVLRVSLPERQLSPIVIGESSSLLVGQKVFAIGNPFGLDQTLTTGVVSGLGREIRSKTDRPINEMIQTNAAINPGNSGGPLLDSAGRLIGVNTAIYSPSGTSAGVGFAIPVNTVGRVIPQLIKHRRVISPTLDIVPFDPGLTDQTGLKGVLVKYVAPSGAAEKAGVEPFRYDPRGEMVWGDLIVGINDDAIAEIDDLYDALDKYNVSDTVRLTVIRAVNTQSPQQLKISITLGGNG